MQQVTIDHMFDRLLVAKGNLSPESYSILDACDEPAGDARGTPEDYLENGDFYREYMYSFSDVPIWIVRLFETLEDILLSSAATTIFGPYLAISGADPIEISLPHLGDIHIPETENHRLMIETSKFLINQRMIELIGDDDDDELEASQRGVRDWLLQRLQSIMRDAFREYNSCSCTRYSITAIQNLYDFARDPEIWTASQMVLDLTAAEFAAVANLGRRVVTFRRLEKHKRADLYQLVSGADFEVVRAPPLAGQTQLMGGVPKDGTAGMVFDASSRYRLPATIFEAYVDRTLALCAGCRG